MNAITAWRGTRWWPFSGWCVCIGPGTATAVLLRHADVTYVDGDVDPQLNPAGVERAQALRHVLADTDVTSIVVTKWRRTQQTVAQLAGDLGRPPVIIDDPQAIVTHIRQQPASATVLVVGHTESLPKIVTGLGGPTLTAIGPTQFDRLFVLVEGRLVRIRYGA